MVVRLAPAVVEGRPAGRVDVPREAQLAQQLERRVDGGEGDAGEPLGDGLVHLLGAQVSLAAAELAVDHEPLRSDPLSAGAEEGDELLIGI